MRKLIFVLILLGCFGGCSENKSEDSSTKSEGSDTSGNNSGVSYPFTATYSSSFEMGDEKNSRIVLDAWKAWQDNEFEKVQSSFADTVTVEFYDGAIFHGSVDSFIVTGKMARSNFTKVSDSIIAWISTRSKDRNENIVLIWGTEYSTDKKGKSDTIQLHEVWRVKNGKVDWMRQYAVHRK